MNIKLRFIIFYALYILTLEVTRNSTEEGFTILKNHSFSKKCTKCPPGWGVAKRCASNTDTHCVKCIQGKTYSSHWSFRSPCWPCSKCGIGLYEAHECSQERDTICDECISYLDQKNTAKRSKDFLQKCTFMYL